MVWVTFCFVHHCDSPRQGSCWYSCCECDVLYVHLVPDCRLQVNLGALTLIVWVTFCFVWYIDVLWPVLSTAVVVS